MKKVFLASVLSLSLLAPTAAMYAGGGDSFAGGLAGGMVGGLVSGAMTKDRSGSRAEQKVDAIQREQQYDRYVSQKMSFNMLMIILVVMFFAIIVLGFLVLKIKK
jgi:preprotein translocase subunit Sec63